MQEFWEAYMKPLDGRPAAVSFNAEAADMLREDNGGMGFVGFVKVKLKRPTERGLVDAAEHDDIGFVEDRLELEALRYRIGKYVGRIVTGGEVTFVYYLKYDFEWPDAVDAAMEAFDYTYETGSRMDMEWEVYRKLLYPTPKEWQMIHNHHTCDRLREAGDDLRQPRAVEHTAYFPSSRNRDDFTAAVEKEGFRLQRTPEPADGVPQYGAVFYRIDVPHYYEIDDLTLHLIDLAESFGGEYDGWETSLVKG